MIVITLEQVRGGLFSAEVKYPTSSRFPNRITELAEQLAKEAEEKLSAAILASTAGPHHVPAATGSPSGTISSVSLVTPTPPPPPARIIIGADGQPRVVQSESPERASSTPATVEPGGSVTMDVGSSIKVTRFGEPPGGNGTPALPSFGMFNAQTGDPSFTTPGAPVSTVKAVVPPTVRDSIPVPPAVPTAPAAPTAPEVPTAPAVPLSQAAPSVSDVPAAPEAAPVAPVQSGGDIPG